MGNATGMVLHEWKIEKENMRREIKTMEGPENYVDI